jgi:hypothetical protein
MTEQLITKKTFELAKLKGFDVYTCRCGGFPECICNHDELLPTQTLVQQWLREKYHLYVRVATNSITAHFPMIELAEVGGTHLKGPAYIKNYETYEDALEIGLQEALKLI